MSTFKKVSLAIIALAVVAAVAWTALRSDQDGTARDATLRLRLESFSLGLDPANILDTQSRRIIDMLHARLIAENERGEFSAEIAERWEWIDPKGLRLTLRTGLTFSDGRPVRAQDAAWSLCRHLQPGAVFQWLFANIEHRPRDEKAVECTGLQANDDRALTIRVLHSPARLMHALASSMGAVVPEGSRPGEYGSVVGAGPYGVDRIESNAAVYLVQHQGGPIKPGVARVAFRYIPDDAAAAAQFAAGDLDVLEIGNPRLWEMTAKTRAKAETRSQTVDTHQVRLLIFNLERLQQALTWSEQEARGLMAAFREASRKPDFSKVYGDLGRPASSAYFPARRLEEVAKLNAGVPPTAVGKGTNKVQIILENDPYSEQIVAALPRRVGSIEIGYIGLDKSLLIERLIKREYDIASIGLEALVADPVYWTAFFKPGSTFNLFGRAIPQLQDVEASNDNVAMIGRLVDEQGNWIVLFQERRQYLFASRVTGERILPTGLIDFSRISKKR